MARKILVVEDDHNISDLIRMYLEKEGFEVQAVFDFSPCASSCPAGKSGELSMIIIQNYTR